MISRYVWTCKTSYEKWPYVIQTGTSFSISPPRKLQLVANSLHKIELFTLHIFRGREPAIQENIFWKINSYRGNFIGNKCQCNKNLNKILAPQNASRQIDNRYGDVVQILDGQPQFHSSLPSITRLELSLLIKIRGA